MRVLLDTCVISEIQRPHGSSRVRKSVDAIAGSDLYISVVTLGELAKGVALLDKGKRKRDLARWLLTLETDFADRILPIDADTARLWGELTAQRQKIGRPLAMADGLIAATAARHGLHIMTRNVDDFSDTGAHVVNPWA